jgi:hypothetical protein
MLQLSVEAAQIGQAQAPETVTWPGPGGSLSQRADAATGTARRGGARARAHAALKRSWSLMSSRTWQQ